MYHFYPSFASMYIFHSLKNEMYEYKINNSIVNFNIFSFLPYLGKWKVCFLLGYRFQSDLLHTLVCLTHFP